jgi:hypothetical protein
MPIIKANEPVPEGPVIIGIYGEPGIAKTTIANTADTPLLCDFDRGSRRSLYRKDTLVLKSWNDVLDEEKKGSFKGYKTIIIDTAKAALDDFLMSFVVERDFKLRNNKLGAYGAIGDEFKLFLNARRNEGADIIIVAHAKKDEDTKKQIPDVTGQSYQLMLRVCDQVGFVSMINNKRTIQFNPTDLTVGKNTAGLATIEIPDKSDPALKTFMQGIIKHTREAMAKQSEEQTEALDISEKLQNEIATCETPELLTEILVKANELPEYLKAPLKKLIAAHGKEKGWVVNMELKRFELPAAASTTGPAAAAAAKVETPATENNSVMQPGMDTTNFDQRCNALCDAGMSAEMDRLVMGELVVSYEDLRIMKEEDFNAMMVRVSDAAKKAKKKNTGKRLATA